VLSHLVGHQEEHPACKNRVMRCWRGYLSGASDLHVIQLMPLPPIISCFVKNDNGFTFLVPAYPGCPIKEAIKWLFVCPKWYG